MSNYQAHRERRRDRIWRHLREDLSDINIFISNIDKKGELVIILMAFLIIGTAGYILIEGWPFLDSLYMVIITMSTIGYGETRPLSDSGRIFTLILIVVGVIIGSYAASATIETLTSENFHHERRNLRRRRRLRRVKNHTIICGFGRLGRTLAKELLEREAPLIVIDPNSSAIDDCDKLNIPSIHGNAADELILAEAGIEHAKALVAVANSDAENVFIILSARALNETVDIIARYNSEASVPKLKRAGAQTVISPHVIAGRRISHVITNPRITRFLDGVLEIGKQRLRLADFVIHENSTLVGQTLREARLQVTVLAVSRPDQDIISLPNAETVFLPGVELVVMGLDEELKNLANLVGDNGKGIDYNYM